MNDDASAASLLSLHADARAIFAHALDRCRVSEVFRERVRCEGTTLISPGGRIDLAGYRHVLVIALGKAAVPMTQSLLDILPPKVNVGGVCSAPVLPSTRDGRIRYYAGGHPLPNQDSLRAARQALRLLQRATKDTFVFYLISGGGSTLFDMPLDPDISLADSIAFHQALIASGATIAEINTLRKHFSAVKGGRLAAAAPKSAKLTLQIVDVPARHQDTVASGPTLVDASTVEDCRGLLDRYRLLEKFPPPVQRFFAHPDLPETPGDKASLRRATELAQQERHSGELITLLSNEDLLRAAGEKAISLGYEIVLDNGCDDWPYDVAAAYLVDRLMDARQQHAGRRVCLLSGGEVTVHMDRMPGTGGRNQQFALACAQQLHQKLPGQPVACLSAGSDGIDGTSHAAGALVDPGTLLRAGRLGFDPATTLAAFDAYPLFAALGDTVLTGPTGNNLRDLRILLSR